MSSGLLDTGVFIAREVARPLGPLQVHRTVRLTDALIAATAIAHGLPVVTQDADFDQMANAHHLLRVVKV